MTLVQKSQFPHKASKSVEDAVRDAAATAGEQPAPQQTVLTPAQMFSYRQAALAAAVTGYKDAPLAKITHAAGVFLGWMLHGQPIMEIPPAFEHGKLYDSGKPLPPANVTE